MFLLWMQRRHCPRIFILVRLVQGKFSTVIGRIRGHDRFLSQLGWREFSYHQLYHFPQLPEQPWRPEFSRFPWEENPTFLKRWQKGETGYPIVDAGMRQLMGNGLDA